jgi:hypothetical protein
MTAAHITIAMTAILFVIAFMVIPSRLMVYCCALNGISRKPEGFIAEIPKNCTGVKML